MDATSTLTQTRPRSPCKHCTDRFVIPPVRNKYNGMSCHSICVQYEKYLIDNKTYNKLVKEQKSIELYFGEVKKQNLEKNAVKRQSLSHYKHK